MSRSSKKLPGTPGKAPTTPMSGVSSPRSLPQESIPDVVKPPRNPRGLKARDYGFMYHHHPNEADRFDDLIADYKGASKDDDRAMLQRRPREYLIRMLNEAIDKRKTAEDETKQYTNDTIKYNKDATDVDASMQTDVTALRELQLELQLLALQYDYKDKELSQDLYIKAKNLRDAKETMQKHVDGLEDSWEAYISKRDRETKETVSVREKRIKEFEEQHRLINGRLEEVQSEIERYIELNKKSTRMSSRQSKKIKKLSTLLGIPLPVPQKRAAFAGKAEVFGDTVTTETASYSTEYCSTCGETLSSSSSSRSSSSSSVSMKSALGLSKPPDIRDSVITIQKQQARPLRSTTNFSPRNKRDTILAAVHKAVIESRHIDPEAFENEDLFSNHNTRSQPARKVLLQRHKSRYEGKVNNADPERGFRFPFFRGHHHL
eukprot:TRINITY_DN3639_c1_g1_i1.p1 TRINITY_DN3639_c1_g1~~TRINITY_DN3639_c1_g1_i1.p1  ORF type:complete len:447 (+),score=91.91 TRINITY_DN3639_c1_g1_i1:43-1341(+)